MAFCTACGATLPENAAFCPACSRAVGGSGTGAAPAPSFAAPGLDDNVAGALAYVTIIPAIIFLLIEPYNRKPFVRFHAFQSIFLCVAAVAFRIALSFFLVFGHIFGFISMGSVVDLAFFVLWVFCIIKAAQGQWWEIPVLGPVARQQAGG